ncbi:hypothetical protein B0H11DRAFT_2250580 [Mycena galericulata]|nr:hypothetical protein B0H11DRAFT_2250580 [Mycena galericulata]
MAPKYWGSDKQVTWLKSYVGKDIMSKSDGDQISFFTRIDAEWLRQWPEEAVLGLPRDDSDVSLTSDQSALLGQALERRKQQLRTSRLDVAKIRYNRALWKDKRRHRDPQLVELYQTLYPERVTAGLKDANFEAIHKDDVDWVGMEGEEPAPALKATIKQQASARLSARRAVSQKLFDAEMDEVKKKVKLELERVKKAKLENKAEDVELTPELAQLSIDQLEGIIDRLHSLIMEKTGWVGFTMLGGPTPYSCGTSPNGNTFKDSHPDWNEGVSSIFVEFLRRRFPRALRDAMALPDPVDSVKMDCEDDQDDVEELPAKPKPKKQKDKLEFKAPKRSKGATVVAASAAITSSSATPLSSPLPPLPPLDSSAVLDLHQTMDSESTYDISQTAVDSTYNLSQTAVDSTYSLSQTTTDSTSYSTDDTSKTTANTTYDLSFWAKHPGYNSGGPVFSYTEGGVFDSGANDLQPTEGQGMDLAGWPVEEGLLDDFDQFMATAPEYFAPQPPVFFAAPDLSSVHAENREIGALPSGEQALTATPRSRAPTLPTRPSLPATPVGTEVNRTPPKPAMATLSTEAAASTAMRQPSPSNMSLPSMVVSRPSPPNTSPLPLRIARTSSAAAAARGDVVAIAASSAALEAAMEARRKLQEEDTESSSEDEESLAGPQYPISGPMANPPKPYPATKVGGSDGEAGGGRAQGGRGQGHGRGHGRGRGKGKGRGGRGGGRQGAEGEPLEASDDDEGGEGDNAEASGHGSRGGGRGEGRVGRKAAGGQGFEGEASGAAEGEDEDSGAVDTREVGGRGRGQRAPLAFLQTYGDNGEVILLPLDTPDPATNTQRWREIRAMEREQDRKANAAPKVDLLRNPAGGSDLVVLPRLPGAPMLPVPQLGRPGRERRAPKNPNETDEALLQRLEKSKEMLKEKSKGQEKRKGQEENEGPRQKRARTC